MRHYRTIASFLILFFVGSLAPSFSIHAAPIFQKTESAASKKKKRKPAAKERIELLLKVKFDRTPNGLLKAWSAGKVKKRKKKKDDKDQAKRPTAVITNAFKDFVFFKLDEKSGDIKKDALFAILDDDDQLIGTIKILTVDDLEISAKVQPLPETKNTESKTEPTVASKPSTSTGAAKPAVDGSTKDGQPATTTGDQPANDAETKPTNQPDEAKKADASKPVPPSLPADVGSKIKLKKNGEKEQAKEQTARLQAEIAQFSQHVSLGQWDKVKIYLNETIKDKKEAQKVYSYLLTELVVAMPEHKKNGAQKRAQAESQGQSPPHSLLSPLDVLQLAEASPQEISIIRFADRGSINADPNPPADTGSEQDNKTDDVKTDDDTSAATSSTTADNENPDDAVAQNDSPTTEKKADLDDDATSAKELAQLASLLKISMKAGYDMQPLWDRCEAGTEYFGGSHLGKRITLAHLLMDCKLYDLAESYIPKVEDENYHDNIYSLRIWKQLAEIRYAKKRESRWLKTIWMTNQNIFKAEAAEQDDIDKALARLIEVAPQLDKSIGQKWLDESFTQNTERGVQLLAALGSISAKNFSNANSIDGEERLKMLKLQNRAVEKLLEVSPDKAQQWNGTLSLLAQNWIQEAQVSIDEAPNATTGMEEDRYGNYYWNSYNDRSSKDPIKIIELLPLLPSEQWQANISPLLLTDIQVKRAKLHMQIKEYAESFALIQPLAEQDKKLGTELAEEFLQVWTNINDPNSNRNRRNSYRYYYGWNEKAESIPLTRSKQDRSLQELKTWVDKIRELKIEDVDEKYLVDAFVTVHSSAEVFQMDRMKAIFGNIEKLKPETIASLSQTMRQNLATDWRSVKNQEENKTKRRAPEIIQEVLRGYQVAINLTTKALEATPDDWRLHLADASLVMDLNAFQQSLQKTSEYSVLREASMDMFAKAAVHYIDKVEDLEKSDLTTEVFDRWLYAALGAVDLGSLDARTLPMTDQFPRIRQAMMSLPDELAEYHMGQFANNLFARMSPVKPELKFRYLKHGFEVVGDHPLAWEARELLDYYKDLIGEIKLDIQLDGDRRVGTDVFGIYVNIVHTQEIEREAGGFGKYATNQNQMRWSYNYGRPTEDYRDKFIDSTESALEDHFDVLSVTFMGEENMESRPTIERGWRVTPYAYVALQAKGDEVDRVSPLALDMDFLDTSGFVVIPVESPELVIDCSSVQPRPIQQLKLTRTLDERQINDGKLILEVSATGKGLIPKLDQLMELEMDDFEVVNVVDQGCLPTSFDLKNPEIQILSDRSWTVEYQAKDDAAAAQEFVFSETKMDIAADKIQRYEDADLVAADSIIKLEKNLGRSGFSWLGFVIPLLGIVAVGVVAVVMTRGSGPVEDQQRFEVPQDVNPFTVLSLLKDIRHHNGIDTQQREKLSGSINRIEQYYFSDDQNGEPCDLESLAVKWVSQTKDS